jgi:predicted PurR-regulated permease PerM
LVRREHKIQLVRQGRLAFLGITTLVTVGSLIIVGPIVAAVATAVLGTAASLVGARFVRSRSDVVAGSIILTLVLCAASLLAALVYLAATGGLE